MKIDKYIIKTSSYAGLVFLFFVLVKCANVEPPSGGPKDVKAPEVMFTNPQNHSTNFSGKTIKIVFNEPIRLSQLKQNLIINPYYDKKDINLQTRKNELTITFQEPLDTNTTYSLDLSDGIADITEGNKIKDMKFTFSTGNALDTAKITGQTCEYFTGNKMKEVLVGLYSYNDTINPQHHKPLMKTYTDTGGKFNLQHIKPGIYSLYAIKDKNENDKFDYKDEKIAFINKPVKLFKSANHKLNLVKQDFEPPRFLTLKHDKNIIIKLNEALRKYKIETKTDTLLHEPSPDKNKIIIYNDKQRKDSIPINIWVSDSSYNDTTYKTKIKLSGPPEKTENQKVIRSIEPKDKSALTDSLNLKIKFHNPVKHTITDSLLTIQQDSLQPEIYNTESNKLVFNSIKTSLSFHKKIDFKDSISIFLKENAFISIYNDSSKKVKRLYKKLNKRKRSSISFHIKTDKKPIIIQLLNQDREIIRQKKHTYQPVFSHLKPGNYSIRLIHDKNNNGFWDWGNYKTNKHPEEIKLPEKTYELKERWNIENAKVKF